MLVINVQMLVINVQAKCDRCDKTLDIKMSLKFGEHAIPEFEIEEPRNLYDLKWDISMLPSHEYGHQIKGGACLCPDHNPNKRYT